MILKSAAAQSGLRPPTRAGSCPETRLLLRRRSRVTFAPSVKGYWQLNVGARAICSHRSRRPTRDRLAPRRLRSEGGGVITEGRPFSVASGYAGGHLRIHRRSRLKRTRARFAGFVVARV